MSQAKEYFHLIEKLENDPEFCFMVTNAGNILLQKTIYKPRNQHISEEKISKFVENLGFQWLSLRECAKEIRHKFKIEDGNHPTYKQCLETISKNSTWSLMYAYFTQNRFELGEPSIATKGSNSYYYARYVLEKPFEMGEKAISDDCKFSIYYSQYVLNRKRFEIAEPKISQSPVDSLNYAKVIGMFKLGEPAIATNAECSYEYALEILRGRFELGEDAMMQDESIMLKYAQNIMKGKLPEKMHNAMVLLTYGDKKAA